MKDGGLRGERDANAMKRNARDEEKADCKKTKDAKDEEGGSKKKREFEVVRGDSNGGYEGTKKNNREDGEGGSKMIKDAKDVEGGFNKERNEKKQDPKKQDAEKLDPKKRDAKKQIPKKQDVKKHPYDATEERSKKKSKLDDVKGDFKNTNNEGDVEGILKEESKRKDIDGDCKKTNDGVKGHSKGTSNQGVGYSNGDSMKKTGDGAEIVNVESPKCKKKSGYLKAVKTINVDDTLQKDEDFKGTNRKIENAEEGNSHVEVDLKTTKRGNKKTKINVDLAFEPEKRANKNESSVGKMENGCTMNIEDDLKTHADDDDDGEADSQLIAFMQSLHYCESMDEAKKKFPKMDDARLNDAVSSLHWLGWYQGERERLAISLNDLSQCELAVQDLIDKNINTRHLFYVSYDVLAEMFPVRPVVASTAGDKAIVEVTKHSLRVKTQNGSKIEVYIDEDEGNKNGE